MDVAGKALSERITGALVVFLVFVAFDYFQGEYDWETLFLIPIVFFVFMIVIDVGLSRFS
jgi:uncharacterized membrane protein YoaK (UPF0700 family)